MNRKALVFASTNLIAAVVSLVSVCVFTRMLAPAEFGSYSLALGLVTTIQGSAVTALGIGVNRFYPSALAEGGLPSFLKTWYGVLAALCGLLILIGPPILLFLPVDATVRLPLALALPLFVLRSLVYLNQAVNRAADAAGRYAIIDCLHTLLGFALGVALIFWFSPSAASVLGGMTGAAAVCAMLDVRRLSRSLQGGSIGKNAVRELARFAGPLALALATGCLLQFGDRFLIGALAGADELGIYAVAYSLIERPTSLIGASISVAIFPLAAQALERHGASAARVQTGRNGVLQLALLAPACAGLFLCSRAISDLLVGPAFRDGVAALMPVMAVTALIRVITAHFLEHAFYLAHRSDLQLRVYAAAATASVVLNLLLLPICGAGGAAWAALVCQSGAAVACWLLSRRIFPLGLPSPFPLKQTGRACSSALASELLPMQLAWRSFMPTSWLSSRARRVVSRSRSRTLEPTLRIPHDVRASKPARDRQPAAIIDQDGRRD